MRWAPIPVVLLLVVSIGCGQRPSSTSTGPSAGLTITEPATVDIASSTITTTTTKSAPSTVTTAPATTIAPPITTAPTTAAPSTTTAATTTAPARDPLAVGSRGGDVALLQQRLLELGYWTGETDGVFAAGTQHAVVAFQKVQGLARDGVVGPETAAALAGAGRAPTASRTGHVTEVDMAHQVLIVADEGQATWVFDTSTGSVPGSTPAGRWTVFIEINGYEHGNLGVLYRPRYFAPRVAVHGYPDVPSTPASHGCVRVINPAMDFIWAASLMPMGSAVWVY